MVGRTPAADHSTEPDGTRMNIKTLLCCSITTATLLASSLAAAQAKPEDALAYRKSVFGLIAWNFGPMSGMVRGRVPWDDAEFGRRAQRVAQLAPMAEEGFPQGSKVGDSAAKAAIWENWTDFEAKLQTFRTESAELARLASSGADADALKAQFGKVGGSCKGCHDNYKED